MHPVEQCERERCHPETCKGSPSMLHQLLQQPLRLPPNRFPLIVEQLLQDDPSSRKVRNSNHSLLDVPAA